MNQIQSIFRNTSLMTIAQFVSAFALFIWTIGAARYLGVSGYGILSFGLSFANLLIIIVDLGMGTYTTRTIVRDGSVLNKFIGNLIPFKIFLSIILFIISILLLILLGYDILSIKVALVFIIQVIFLSMTNLINGVFQAFEDLKAQSIGTIINSVVLLVSFFVVMALKLNIIFVAGTYALGYFIFFIYLFIKFLQKFQMPKLEFDFKFWKNTAIASVPFGLSVFFASLYFTIDIILISYLAGDYPTGIYRSAYNVVTAFATFSGVYQIVIFPVMAKMFDKSEHLLKISLEQSIKYLLLIVLPLVVFIFIYAKSIIDIIYNNQYTIAAIPLRIIVWCIIFIFINGVLNQLLNAINKEIYVTRAFLVVAIFDAIFDIITIPYLGCNGAAIATLISEILICIMFAYPIIKSKYCPDFKLLKTVLKLVVSTIITGLIIYFLNLNMWLAIPIGAIIYFICIVLTRTMDVTDKYVIKQLLGKN